MTVYVWLDYAYYDGLLGFALGVSDTPGVFWLGTELPVVPANR